MRSSLSLLWLSAAVAAVAGCAAGEPTLDLSTQAITDPIPQAAGTYALRFDASNGDQRGYLLRLPAGYNPAAGPYPMVVLFHGAGQSAVSFSNRPGMNRMKNLADAQMKILVFAHGNVNTPLNVPGTWDPLPGSVDLLYAEDLIDFLANSPDLAADPARVFAAGFSNGGQFVHALGAGIPSELLGIGVVGGFYGTTLNEPAPPPAGTLLPAFIVHGDADPTVPIAGGDPTADGGLRLSTQDSYDRWYGNNGCTELSFGPVNPPPTFTFLATHCVAGGPIRLRFTTVFGLGHLWPVAADGYDASARMLDFFDAL